MGFLQTRARFFAVFHDFGGPVTVWEGRVPHLAGNCRSFVLFLPLFRHPGPLWSPKVARREVLGSKREVLGRHFDDIWLPVTP